MTAEPPPVCDWCAEPGHQPTDHPLPHDHPQHHPLVDTPEMGQAAHVFAAKLAALRAEYGPPALGGLRPCIPATDTHWWRSQALPGDECVCGAKRWERVRR
jgi:hypothetical protein